MTKILQKINPDIKKINELIEYVTPELASVYVEDSQLTGLASKAVSRFLPVQLKFAEESYVAVEGKEPIGLISLIPDGKQKSRWKINKLVLGVNAPEIGKQLVDYVVNKYGGAGVETFVSIIDENYTEAISLFKYSCAFRSCSKINIWKCDDLSKFSSADVLPELRKAKPRDSEKLLELDSEVLYPQFKSTLAKNLKDFKLGVKRNLLNILKGGTFYSYILENTKKNRIESIVNISSFDNKHFFVDVTLSLAYKAYCDDLVKFAVRKVEKINASPTIYFSVKEYQQTAKEFVDTLTNYGFCVCGNYQVLVKDYWNPVKLCRKKKSPVIIFPDITSPACNIVRLLKNL